VHPASKQVTYFKKKGHPVGWSFLRGVAIPKILQWLRGFPRPVMQSAGAVVPASKMKAEKVWEMYIFLPENTLTSRYSADTM